MPCEQPLELFPQHPPCRQLTGLPRRSHISLFLLKHPRRCDGSKRSAADPLVLRPLAVPLQSLRAASRVWQRISGDPAPNAALTLQSLDSACEEQQDCFVDCVKNVQVSHAVCAAYSARAFCWVMNSHQLGKKPHACLPDDSGQLVGAGKLSVASTPPSVTLQLSRDVYGTCHDRHRRGRRMRAGTTPTTRPSSW